MRIILPCLIIFIFLSGLHAFGSSVPNIDSRGLKNSIINNSPAELIPNYDPAYYQETADKTNQSGALTRADQDKDPKSATNPLKFGLFDDNPFSKRINVYPNPSNGLFNIEYTGKSETNISIEIMSVTGNMVYLRELSGTDNIQETIDLQHISKGVYFLRIKEKSNISTFKIIFR